jgi:pilus assembly protein CpaE
MGREVFWQLPNDYRTMVEVRNNGVPLIEQAPKAAITQSIVALAHALGGDARTESTAEAGKSTIGKWLNLWPSRQGAPAKPAPTPAK